MIDTNGLKKDARQIAHLILDGLDRRRLFYETKDGQTQYVRLHKIAVQPSTQTIYFTVDTRRLPVGVKATDLVASDILADLSLVTGHTITLAEPSELPGDASYKIVYRVCFAPSAPRARAKPLSKMTKFSFRHMPAGGELMVPFGLSHNGHEWRALPKIGHMLLCGTTGAGKSGLFQGIVGALAVMNDPERLHMAIVDGKGGVELSKWARLPHLIAPIATDLQSADVLITRVELEMRDRFDLLRDAACANINEYHDLHPGRPLPYLLLVLDEAGVLCEESGPNGNFTRTLGQILSKGRAAGIRVMMSAQTPTADIVPTWLRDNLVKCCFKTSASTARMVGLPGAERIAGDTPGRFFADLGDGHAQEIQAYYLGREDLLRLAKHAGSQTPNGDKPRPRLSADEVKACRIARDELGGLFIINEIAAKAGPKKEGGLSQYWLKKWAKEAEARGWLTYVGDDDSSGRRMTDELLAILQANEQEGV